MHTDSVFDELGLVVKLATSSRTSHRETPRSNKNRDMQSMQGLSSLRWRDQFTQPKAPLDSADIYPITRSPNNHLETGKTKNLARTYLCLGHPAWSWWGRFMLHSSQNASLDHCCFVKTYNLLPHTPLWDNFIKHIFTCPLSPNGRQASSIWFSWDAHLELAQLNLDDDHHLISSSHGLYEISLLMHAHGKIPNPHRQHKGIYMMG